MTTRKEPFSLGFPGERWSTTIHCLVVQVTDTKHILVTRDAPDKWAVITGQAYIETDSALMAACLVQQRIDEVTTEVTSIRGNNVEQEAADRVVEDIPPA